MIVVNVTSGRRATNVQRATPFLGGVGLLWSFRSFRRAGARGDFIASSQWPCFSSQSPRLKFAFAMLSRASTSVDATNALKQTLTGHTSEVTSASFGPDGQNIVSASEEGTVRVVSLIHV